jgi:hypothetical protein
MNEGVRPFLASPRNDRHHQLSPVRTLAVTAHEPRSLVPLAALMTSLVAVVALTACGTTPAVGPVPGNTISAPPSSSFTTPPAEGLKIEINIDQKSVTPLDEDYTVDRGQTVVLLTRSDHDTSLTVTGPDISRTTFIGRLTTIPTTFVADDPGVIVVRSTDPAATIARLTVR